MEQFSVNGLMLIISVCVIAFFIGRLTSKERKDKKRLEMELEQSREELKNYRSEVTSHFQETAHKVNALTENYRNVYEHLARGAQSLCNKSDAPVLMNELNRNPMLGGETIENSIVDQEPASAKASADNSSGSDAEPEIADKNPDNTTDITASGDQAKFNDGEADQSSDTIESSEVNENTGEAADSDEPIVAADEHIKPEQQTPR
jgi:uncharacterized membrane-anchored protein YhcB (DUF1043 family)